MASERILNEYDGTRLANAVDTFAEKVTGYVKPSPVTPTDAMKAKIPSQSTGDRLADAFEDLATNYSGGASNLPLYEFEESPTHKAHALNDKLFFDLKPYHLTVSSLAVSSLLIKPGNTGANIAEDLTAGEDYGVVGIPNT